TIPDYRQYSGGIVGGLTWKLSDDFSFKSISAYRKNKVSFPIDFDQTNTAFPSGVQGKDFQGYNGSEQISQELQLTGKMDWLNVVAGLYYFHDTIDPAFFRLGINVATPQTPFLVRLQLGGTTKTNAYAAYGQATAAVTDQLSVTAGVRYSHERRASTSLQIIPEFFLTQTDAKSATFNDVSPKFTVDYQWTDDFMTYVTVSRGFKSGGFDVSASPPLVAFKPETIWDYEAGAKLRTSWGTIDVSAFHYDYKNLQLAQIVNGLPNTTNAGSSDVNGVEAAFTVKPTDALTVTTALAYLDAQFNQVIENDTLTGLPRNLRGNRLPGSAKYAANVAVQYDIPVGENTLSLLGEWNWHDRLYFTEFNSKQVSQGAISTINASARYTFEDRQWYVEVYGKNLSDRLIASQKWITGAGFGSMVIGNLAAPRTFGATVHYNF
ncbi:MAG: TonB-dependent receptor, partial [Rhodospirillaceae bacterium]|nr:TonB-dependent receptor [Rhodospirillaceae bacterium]